MTNERKTIKLLCPAPGADRPVEFLTRLGIADYLDRLDQVVASDVGGLGRDVPREIGGRQVGWAPAADKLALGNILIANGQITRTQLDSALLRQAGSGKRLGEELIEAGHVSHGQIEGSLRLQRRLMAYLLSLTVGLAPLATMAPSAEAAQARALMPVSVTVVASARMQSQYQAKEVAITAADVARGHVEISAASRFSVASNSLSGYRIEFHPLSDFFESVSVAGLGNPVKLGADGGTIVQRGPLPPNLTHELSFRFMLRPGTLPGHYPWPLQLAVRAL
jgi:hypothetical protein